MGGQSSEISWTESSQNGLASQGREVAKEEEQGDEEASSSSQGQWSYVDLVSTISLSEANRIASRYSVVIAFLQ